jgi:hypothetical protein
MSLDIKGGFKKPGGYVIQNVTDKNSDSQHWKIEYEGKNLFLIRSALAHNLFLSVIDNSLK